LFELQLFKLRLQVGLFLLMQTGAFRLGQLDPVPAAPGTLDSILQGFSKLPGPHRHERFKSLLTALDLFFFSHDAANIGS
jgi:hypothetical protein